jgi:hypothetical protein
MAVVVLGCVVMDVLTTRVSTKQGGIAVSSQTFQHIIYDITGGK